MSFYGEQVKTHLIDPINDVKNRRSEFRLMSDMLYMSNLRLLNIGMSSDHDSKYNELVGALGVISQISLMDGNQILDSVNKFNILQGFRSYNKSNDDNMELNRALHHNNMGFVCVRSATADLEEKNIISGMPGRKVTADPLTTPTSHIDLMAVFPILRQLKFVHTGLFPKFRVIVQYETDKYALQSGTSQAQATASVIETVEPLLVADELRDEAMAAKFMKEFKGVVFPSVENDRVVVTEVTPAANEVKQQKNTYKINGFNGKTLNRLLVEKQPVRGSEENSAEYKNLASESMAREKFQVRINGANKLPRDGAINHNERLGMLHDTWGQCNVAPASNLVDLVNGTNHYTAPDDKVGHLSYFGMNIGEKVADFQLDYERSGVDGQDQLNQELNLNVFGEVVKSLNVMPGGSYRVSYL